MACGIVIPLSRHRFCAPRGRVATMLSTFSPRSVSSVSYHGRWLQPPLRSRVRLLRRPGCSSCSQLCPGRWGFVQRRPKRALPIEQSADCHSQFTPPNSWHSSIRTAQMPSSAPLPTQRWKIRWIVLSSPNSLGKWFHWQPLRVRKTVPSSIFRWSTRLRPLDLSGSNSSITGSIRSQGSSGTSQILGNGFPSSTIHLHPPLGIIPPTTSTH